MRRFHTYGRFVANLLAVGLLSAAVPAAAQVVGTANITDNSSDGGCTAVTTACATFDLGPSAITLQVSGTFTGTLTFEATSDGANWKTVMLVNLADGTSATTTSTTGQFSFNNSGVLKVRARATAFASGMATVTATRGGAQARWLAPWFSSIFVSRVNLVTTSTDGLVTQNLTPATVGVPVQISPSNRLSGTGWDTNDTVSRSVSFFTEVLPASGATVGGSWKLGYIDPVTAAVTYPLTIDTAYIAIPSGTVLRWINSSKISAASNGTFVFSDAAVANTVTVTLDDAKTTLSAEAVSMANDAVLFLGSTSVGMLFVSAGTDNRVCQFSIGGASNLISLDLGPSTIFTVTKDTASRINVYYDAVGDGTNGAGFYLQNKRGGTRTMRATLIGG